MSRQSAGFLVVLLAMTAVATVAATATAAEAAERWLRIDFDADLTSYLVDRQSLKHVADQAELWELDVPGRTGLSTGLGSYTLVQRLFDCAARSQRLGEVLRYAKVGGKSERVPHEELSFKVESGSIDDSEFQLACEKTEPPVTAATVQYATLEQAVARAFPDAIKLPSQYSNRTLQGMRPPPPQR